MLRYDIMIGKEALQQAADAYHMVSFESYQVASNMESIP